LRLCRRIGDSTQLPTTKRATTCLEIPGDSHRRCWMHMAPTRALTSLRKTTGLSQNTAWKDSISCPELSARSTMSEYSAMQSRNYSQPKLSCCQEGTRRRLSD